MATYDFRVYARDQYAPEGTPLDEVAPDDNGYAVVEEFDNWCIREVVPNGRSLHIRWGEEYLPLKQSDRLGGWVWPELSGKRYDKLGDSRQTSGLLHLYGLDGRGNYTELKPVLYIVAGSLLIYQYPLLLDRLGQLAVAERSATVAPVEGPLPTGCAAAGYWIRTPSLRHAIRVIEAHDVFVRSWPLILSDLAVSLERHPQATHVRHQSSRTRLSAGFGRLPEIPGGTTFKCLFSGRFTTRLRTASWFLRWSD